MTTPTTQTTPPQPVPQPNQQGIEDICYCNLCTSTQTGADLPDMTDSELEESDSELEESDREVEDSDSESESEVEPGPDSKSDGNSDSDSDSEQDKLYWDSRMLPTFFKESDNKAHVLE